MSGEEAKEEPSTSGETGGKLFLGGLSWDTSEDKLKEHFGGYGEILEAVVMRDRATGRPRGFGFVTFKDKSVADRVVQDIHVIDGRQIDAKKSVPQEQKPKARKIFVGGLAPDTTEADFKEYFSQYGPISDAQIMQDHMTGRSRGFGFITFEEDAAVERVFSAGAMQELGGKRVEIKHATPKGAGSLAAVGSSAARGVGGGSSGGGSGMDRGAGSSSGGSGARGPGFGRVAPIPFGQMPGSPYPGFSMFPYPQGMMPSQAAGPYSMGYPSPYLMMQQISGYPGGTYPFPAPAAYGSPGRGPPQHLAPTQQSSAIPGGGYGRHYEQQPPRGGNGSHMPYPRTLSGNGRGKGKVDSASELSDHHSLRYVKS